MRARAAGAPRQGTPRPGPPTVKDLPVRRPATALVSVALAATLLAGCSSGSGSDASPTPSASATSATDSADLAILSAVTVKGDLGSTPTLTFDQPLTVVGPAAMVETEGDGEEIKANDLVLINYVAINADDGTVLGSTWDDDSASVVAMSDTQIVSALTEALIGHKIGTRVIFAVPGTAATDTAEATPATLMALEATELVPSRATGEAVTPPDGLPTVTLADDGEPSITVGDDVAAPTELVSQTLIKGAGAKVESGQTVTFQYAGWLFDGTVFDSSWANGAPFETPIGEGRVIPGWDQGLVGQTVGSQVLLVIPSALGYGEAGSGETIPANADLIFVVDILAAN